MEYITKIHRTGMIRSRSKNHVHVDMFESSNSGISEVKENVVAKKKV